MIAPPAPDPRLLEEQKRLKEIKNMGLDKVAWDGAVRSFRENLTADQKKTFDANLQRLIGKNDWDSFSESQSGTSAKTPAAEQKPKLSPEEDAKLNDWNKFTTDAPDKYTAKNNSSAQPPTKSDQPTATDDWNNFDAGTQKWENGPSRETGESDIKFHQRLRDWQGAKDYEESRKQIDKDKYRMDEEWLQKSFEERYGK